MTLLVTLASEAVGDKTWWNPYAKGALVALLAVGLFVGSGYLLLYTNVGSRLGFLLTASAFSGFIAVLSIFWITGQFPNGPLGSAQSWPVEEVVSDLADSGFEDVRSIRDQGEEAPGEIAGQVRADLDVELTDGDDEFDLFSKPSDFLVVRSFVVGGGRKWPAWWSEKTTYAVTEVCTAVEPVVLPLAPPQEPECDEGRTQWVVSIKDLGARRLPAWFFFAGSSLLFALSLYALHLYERDVEGGGRRGEPSGNGEAGGEPVPGGTGEAAREPAAT